MSVQDVARMHYEAFNNRTFQANAKKYVDEHLASIDEATGREEHGVQGYVQGTQRWVTAFPDAHIEVVKQQVSGNRVISTLRGTGTFTGQLETPQGTIPGNGRKLDMEFREELEIQNNKMVFSRLSYDMQTMMRQLGIQAQTR